MNSELNYEWACASELRKQAENGKSWIDFSEEEKRLLEKHYSDHKFFPFIKAGLSISTYDELLKYHEKHGESEHSLLETYALKAQAYDIRNGLMDGWSRVVINRECLDTSALDTLALEILGANPKLFVHNCTIITAEKKESREWFRNVFDAGVEKAETIIDLLKLNNSDFRKIPDFIAPNGSYVFNHRGSPRGWFGQKSFYAYRDHYMTKFLKLADKATLLELWFVVGCFFDYKLCHRINFNCSKESYEKTLPEDAKAMWASVDYLDYLQYHKTKRKVAEGLPLKWILPLNQKCMEAIIYKALLKTNFKECLCMYKERVVSTLKVQILERLSDLASTPEEHFTVASIAHKKGEPFNNIWKKHLILSAKALKAKN